MANSLISRPLQKDFLNIPQSPLCYWLRPRFFELLSGKTLGDVAAVVQGLATANDPRFVRFVWEVPPEQHGQPVRKRRWVPFEKGGGYGKWFGHHWWMVDWENDGARIKATPSPRVQNEQYYFKEGWTYTQVARGSLAVRQTNGRQIFGHASNSIFSSDRESKYSISKMLNCRLSTFLIRALSQKISFEAGHIALVPFSAKKSINVESICIELKKCLVARDITERTANPSLLLNYPNRYCKLVVSAILQTLEGLAERLVFDAYHLDKEDIAAVLAETGPPAGWYPLIHGYEAIPSLPDDLPRLPDEVVVLLAGCERRVCSEAELGQIRNKLRLLYEAGPGVKEEGEWTELGDLREDGQEETVTGARIPIPTETFLEELSQKMEIHPISIYWLLKEGIEKQGWRCLPEEKRILEDRFTVLVLQLLGHRWPVQIEGGEPVPEWADQDGIIPLTEGCSEKTLLERIRERIVHEFTDETVTQIERKFAEVVGKPLDAWLSGDFFKRHISQFRKRPIVWPIQSKPAGKGLKGRKRIPAFSCLIYYHKLDADLIHKIRSQYVGPLITRYETELRTIRGSDYESNYVVGRKYQLENWIEELRSFDEELERIIQDGFNTEKLHKTIGGEPLDKWSSLDGNKPQPTDTNSFFNQEKAYFPDINDGVRVNIAPLQRAGLLAFDVLSKKDVEKAIDNRAEWRADERRWCREGKLTKPGWWD